MKNQNDPLFLIFFLMVISVIFASSVFSSDDQDFAKSINDLMMIRSIRRIINADSTISNEAKTNSTLIGNSGVLVLRGHAPRLKDKKKIGEICKKAARLYEVRNQLEIDSLGS